MIDKLFDTWTKMCPEFKTDFGTLDASYRLTPFPRTMAQVFDTRANGYCYGYSPSRGDVPTPTMQCPSATANSTATATPTIEINNVWFQMWIQTLVPGVSSLRVSPDKLEDDHAIKVVRRSVPTVVSKNLKKSNTTMATRHKKAPRGNYIPLPQYCLKANYTIRAPKWNDDKDLQNIRYATYVNATLMEMMGFDMQIYEDTMTFDQMVVDYYNNMPGFTSPAALKNRAYNNRTYE